MDTDAPLCHRYVWPPPLRAGEFSCATTRGELSGHPELLRQTRCDLPAHPTRLILSVDRHRQPLLCHPIGEDPWSPDHFSGAVVPTSHVVSIIGNLWFLRKRRIIQQLTDEHSSPRFCQVWGFCVEKPSVRPLVETFCAVLPAFLSSDGSVLQLEMTQRESR